MICLSIEEIIRKYKVKTNETIIDICTPCSQFKHLIDAFIEANFSAFIVEKPFVVEEDYFNDKKNIKCIILFSFPGWAKRKKNHNYLLGAGTCLTNSSLL